MKNTTDFSDDDYIKNARLDWNADKQIFIIYFFVGL